MVSQLIQKYIWLVQTLLRAGDEGLSLEEICFKWENHFGAPYNRRSFNNHRAVIEELFGISIECDRAKNRYLIRSSGDVSDKDDALSWMLDTFAVGNLLNRSKDRLSGRVSVDEIPSGHSFLPQVMDAMEDNLMLRISYKKYSSARESVFDVRPYAVKEASRRWYLVGYCEQRGAIRVYGMDRILSLEALERHFDMPRDFDVDALFATSYGVYLPENKSAEKIVFRAKASEVPYLKDLPLHHSQELVSEDENGAVFSLFVRADKLLVMDLLSRGDSLEVLSPESLRQTLGEQIRKMSKIY